MGDLQGEKTKELGYLHHITPPQTARLGAKTEQPLPSGFAHPTGGLANGTGMKVERCAYGKQQWRVQTAAVFGHPQLLLRRAQPDPNDIRLALVDEAMSSASSLSVSGRKGGEIVPAI